MIRSKRKVLAVFTSAVIASGTGKVLAQDLSLEEIVVTAQKRAETLQDVPVSVNAVSGMKMSEAGITNLEGMTAYVPNLTMNQTGIGTIIAIRGISSGINQGFEQSVGQYVDGIYYGRAQLARAPLMDMERVEVLRGPQSILFGKNSIAGAISIITAKPTDEFEGSFTALYEPDHGEQDLRLVLSGPITDTLSGRLAILDRSIDGYFDNTTLNRDESDEEEKVFRGTLAWVPTDDLEVTLKIEDGSFDTKGRFMEVINPAELPGGLSYKNALAALTGGAYILDDKQDYKRQSNGDFGTNDTENVTLNVDYQLGDHTLTFVSGYNAYEYDENCDCDFIGASVFTANSAEEFDQFSQEIRITSPVGGTFDYIAGVYYQTTDMEFTDAINVPANSLLVPAFSSILPPPVAQLVPQVAGASTRRTYSQDTDIWSVFAQGTWNINDESRLIVGGRFTQEDKDATRHQFHINNAGVVQPQGLPSDPLNILFGLFRIEPYDQIEDDRDESAFTPLITYQYDLNEDAMLYATYTTGFKSGGFDVRSNAHPNPAVNNALLNGTVGINGVFQYDEEEATSFEIGGKFTLADGAAEINVALFHTSYDDLQVSQFDGTLGFNVTNAGEATSQGLELDGRWRLTPEFTLSGSFAYLDFEYDKFPNAECAFGQTPDSTSHPGLCDASGKSREYIPDLQATLSGDYEYEVNADLVFRAVVDLIYSDSYLTSPSLDSRTEQDAYTKLNARLSLGATDGKWDVALVGKNLTDEEVISYSNSLPLSTTLTSGTGTAYYAFYDRPATVAVQGTIRF